MQKNTVVVHQDSDIRLAGLLIVFFQRTNFLNPETVIDFITNNIYDFKKSKIINLPKAPILIENTILHQVISDTSPFVVSIYNNRIDFFSNKNFDSTLYNDIFGAFIATAKIFSKFVASQENICGRIGMVNDSFMLSTTPSETIKNKFIKDKSMSKISTININYSSDIKLFDLEIAKITSIQPGIIHTTPQQPGILLHRDINIKKMQLSIDSQTIEEFINMAGGMLTKEEMEGIIHE